jgi:hypothetical protein
MNITELLNPVIIFENTLSIGLTVANIFFVIMTWVIYRKILVLNRTLQTPWAPYLELIAKLFFAFSTVTLIFTAKLWINPST